MTAKVEGGTIEFSAKIEFSGTKEEINQTIEDTTAFAPENTKITVEYPSEGKAIMSLQSQMTLDEFAAKFHILDMRYKPDDFSPKAPRNNKFDA